MITIFLLAYVGLAVIAFKVIKIKVSPVSVAVTVLVGASLVGGILVAWKFSAPITDQTTLARKITNLIADPDSKELIVKIYARESQPLKKGDPIWEVDSRPNQYAANQAIAQVAMAEQEVLNAQAGIEVATARVEEAKANSVLARAQLDTALKTRALNPGAVAKLNVEVLQQSYQASGAAVNNATANQKVSESALTTAQNKLKASQAQLELAELNLSQNIKRAPSDGYLVNFQTVEGTMTTALMVQSQGLFLNTSDPGVVVAIYPQNLVKNVEPGNSVDLAFKSLPGQIATGKVDAILDWTGEGQLQRQTSSNLPIVKNLKSRGFLGVRIMIDDAEIANSLPLGAAGSVAIYTNTGKPFHVISKITIRIKMWMNYLPI
jgi:multidrug resistance efflux pump